MSLHIRNEITPIHTYIFVKEIFTLPELNAKIQCHSIYSTQKLNEPPLITLDHLKKKLILKMSASEINNLI